MIAYSYHDNIPPDAEGLAERRRYSSCSGIDDDVMTMSEVKLCKTGTVGSTIDRRNTLVRIQAARPRGRLAGIRNATTRPTRIPFCNAVNGHILDKAMLIGTCWNEKEERMGIRQMRNGISARRQKRPHESGQRIWPIQPANDSGSESVASGIHVRKRRSCTLLFAIKKKIQLEKN